MQRPLLEFVPGVYYRVLGAALTVLLLGWLASVWLTGELTIVDVVGSLICVPIATYVVHLWIVYARGEGEE